MALTPQDIKDKTFTPTPRLVTGYVESEVDDFLDEVYEDYLRLTDEADHLRTQQADRPAPPAPAAVEVAPAAAPAPTSIAATADTATGILTLAQRTADEHVAEAQRTAESLVAEARERSERTDRETEERRTAAVGALEVERTRLERTLDELRAFEREYRSRLRSYLQSQLSELDAEQGATGPGTAGEYLLGTDSRND